jgi:predicted DNA-binding transcriptional regulator AlpA
MDTLLTSKQLAVLVGLSVRSLERLRASGGGPKFIKLGQSVRYREADLAAWLAAQTMQSPAEAATSL